MQHLGVAIAWSECSRRTRWLARLLKLRLVELREGPPYLRSFKRTVGVLSRAWGSVVLIQGTHGPLALLTALLDGVKGYVSVMDMHSGFVVPFTWKSYLLNTPFRDVVDALDVVIVHNREVLKLLPSRARSRSVVVYDPPIERVPTLTRCGEERDGVFKVVFPSGGLADEPLRELVEAFNARARGLDVTLYVTGPHPPRREGNVVFTGFLPRGDYLDLLSSADLVLALTSVEYTVLSAAWEALYLGKPMVISMTRTLHSMFKGAGVFVRNVEEVVSAILELHDRRDLLDEYARRARLLAAHYRAAHRRQVVELLRRVRSALGD